MKFSVVEIESFRKFCRSTLRGFCTVASPPTDCASSKSASTGRTIRVGRCRRRWRNLTAPARNLSRSADGRPIFMPALMFFDADTRRAFSANVVSALLAQYPTAFDCGEEEEAA